jgi:hypothetical protein
MREKSQLPEIEAELDAILKKYGAFLRQTIARICPKDLGIQLDDIEQEARLRLWRAIKAEREINFLLIKKRGQCDVTGTGSAGPHAASRMQDRI